MKFQPQPHRASARGKSGGFAKPKGFTLVEILVVLAIIAILAALLFPAFKTAQENGKQSSCVTNLQQIYLAARQYYDDEKRYPLSVAVLLPNTEKLDNSAASVTAPATKINNVDCDPATSTCTNVRGTGYLKGTKNLLCPDDDTQSPQPRSSYSNLATGLAGEPADPTGDLSRYVWNYWGYKADGFAYKVQTDNTTATGYFGDPAQVTSIAGDKRYLRDSTKVFDAATNPVDLQKLPRLANRFAPAETIMAHCVYHRLPTSNMAKPIDLYDAAQSAYTAGASDILLRADGTAAKAEVTTWNANNGEKWIKQIR